MPKPNPGESQNDFMSRCVPMLREEGKTQEQAVGACMGMYRTYQKGVIMEALEALLPDEPDEQPEKEEPEEEQETKSTETLTDAPEYQEDAEEVEEPLNLSYIKSLQIEPPDFLAVKFVARDEIRGYSHLWGSEALTDIEVEYFTSETDFWDKRFDTKTRPLTWDHAQDRDFKGNPVIGQILDFGDDDIGRWYVAKLERSHQYNQAIAELIKQGRLGTSSDSAPQYVERVKTGKATWLKTWPFFAAALTDTPCEPRMIGSLEFLKSLGITLPETSTIDVEGDAAILDYFKVKYQLGD